MSKRLAFLAAIALAAPAALVAAPIWHNVFAATGGGHRVGNPDAETKLIEFVSYTCSHCAEFARQSDIAMAMGYVGSGKVSVEVRHAIRNPVDLAAALVTECGAEDKFFGNHRAMSLGYPTWFPKAIGATPAQQQRWGTGTTGQRMRAIAGDLDFYELMEPRGYSHAALDKCLTDEARAKEIAEQSRADAATYNIQSTPSFAIGGKLLDGVHNWATLQKALDAR